MIENLEHFLNFDIEKDMPTSKEQQFALMAHVDGLRTELRKQVNKMSAIERACKKVLLKDYKA